MGRASHPRPQLSCTGPFPPPPASPSPSPSSPFPPRLCCGRCCLRSVSSRSVSCRRVPWPACLSLPLFASCLVSVSFRFASFAVCLIGSFQGPYHEAYVTCSSYWSKPCPFHQIANSISFTAGCRILIFKRCLIDIGVGTSQSWTFFWIDFITILLYQMRLTKQQVCR